MSTDLTSYIEQATVSVSEYLELLNSVLTGVRPQIEGEVSDFKETRDWVFFALKDAEEPALLSCGMHASAFRRIGVPLEDGMSIRITGNGKITPKSGRFNFWVSNIELVGEGALRRAYELLLAKLRDEGLFARKRDIPTCIRHIGVISSRDGVVIHDLQRNLKKRGIRIDFLHASVEGAAASTGIAQALRYFNTCKEVPEVVVLIRGGGSLESLQGFNSEEVCRAIFGCRVPVLAGIGHETDAPIATMVADWSASTPTAVAQVINQSWDELERCVPELERDILHLFASRLNEIRHQAAVLVRDIASTMARLTGAADRSAERLSLYVERIGGRVASLRAQYGHLERSVVTSYEQRLRRAIDVTDMLEQKLRLVDPIRNLSRGYALAYGPDGKVLKAVTSITPGTLLRVRIADGSVDTRVEGITSEE
jgi:exodeoxyribonuclease VII large subunit